jgi:hypothetical protein
MHYEYFYTYSLMVATLVLFSAGNPVVVALHWLMQLDPDILHKLEMECGKFLLPRPNSITSDKAS